MQIYTFIIGKPDVQITLGTPNRRGPYKLYNPRQLFLKNHQKTLVITPPKKKTLQIRPFFQISDSTIFCLRLVLFSLTHTVRIVSISFKTNKEQLLFFILYIFISFYRNRFLSRRIAIKSIPILSIVIYSMINRSYIP